MKYIKLFENESWDIEIPQHIKNDLEDICWEMDEINIQHGAHVGSYFDHRFDWGLNALQIWQSPNGSIFSVENVDEVIERIKTFLKMNNYKYKIQYLNESSHYYSLYGKVPSFHRTASRIIIHFIPPGCPGNEAY